MGGIAGMSKTGMAAAVATGMVGATAVLSVLKGLFKRLVDSWPGLQASLDIMNKSLMLFLRPIAIILDMFIRPLAILLMRLAIKFFKWFQEQDIQKTMQNAVSDIAGGTGDAAKKITEGLDSAIEAIDAFDPQPFIDAMGNMFVKVVDELDKVPWVEKITLLLTVIGEKLFAALVDALPYVAYGIVKFGEQLFEGLLFLIDFIVDGLGNAFGMIYEGIGKLAGWVWDKLVEVFSAALEGIKNFGSWLWDSYVAYWQAIFDTIAGFGKWLWDSLTGVLSKAWETITGIGAWVLDQLKNAFKSIWDAITGVAGWVGDQIKSAIGKIVDSIPGAKEVKGAVSAVGNTVNTVKNAVGGAINYVGNKLSGKDFILTKSGQFIEADPEDMIMAKKGGFSGGGGNTSVSIQINALDAQSIDQRTINKLADSIQQVLKRNLYGLSKESYGI